ncbi:hypothetical protein DIPPA_32324 [Diplonema papillatum]|nr:hypothetical protein DIPPA_32324 [Diplonema papillatum]
MSMRCRIDSFVRCMPNSGTGGFCISFSLLLSSTTRRPAFAAMFKLYWNKSVVFPQPGSPDSSTLVPLMLNRASSVLAEVTSLIRAAAMNVIGKIVAS